MTINSTILGGGISVDLDAITRNWKAKAGISQGLPDQPGRFDQLAIAVTAAALLGWVLAPSTNPVGIGLALAGLVQLVRLLRWRGWKTLRDPIVVVLHVDYLWIPAGLLLLGWSIVDPAIPRTAAIHALTAGAMATMILAVMTRATLGHTGREIQAGGATVAIYVLVTLGALLRLAAPMGWLDYRMGIEAAGAAWAGAMLLFAIVYGPILFRPRPGE